MTRRLTTTELIHHMTRDDVTGRTLADVLADVKADRYGLHRPTSQCDRCGRDLYPATEDLHLDWCQPARGERAPHRDT